jgi:uncharacterized protein (TIGR03067 family)
MLVTFRSRFMKKCLFGLLVVTLLVAAEDKKADDVKTKVQGTWKVVGMERDGKKAPEDEFKGMSLTFEGDKVIAKRESGSKAGTFRFDATPKPPHFDLTSDDGKDAVKMLFQLDGDTLKLYGDKREKGDRPKTYEAAATVITLKREKK